MQTFRRIWLADSSICYVTANKQIKYSTWSCSLGVFPRFTLASTCIVNLMMKPLRRYRSMRKYTHEHAQKCRGEFELFSTFKYRRKTRVNTSEAIY